MCNDSEIVSASQEAFQQSIQERMRQPVCLALVEILEEEMTAFIGDQSYECSEKRKDQRSGHSTHQQSDEEMSATCHRYVKHASTELTSC
jgi:transposase-like protein